MNDQTINQATGKPDAGPLPDQFKRTAATEGKTPEAAKAPETKLIGPVSATDKKAENKAKLAAAVAAKKAKPAKASTSPATAAKKAKPATDKGEEGEGDEGPKLRRSIVPMRFKQAYAAHDNTCGDKLALALKHATTTTNSDGRDSLDLPALKAIAAANEVNVKPYEGLNPGQWRMNVSNKLRGIIKQGGTVVVGKQRFAKSGLVKEQEQAVA